MTTWWADWARGVKDDLNRLEAESGIPALFACAQFIHESYTDDGPSELAAKHNNWAGLKFAKWEQEEFACYPVAYGTWEEENGERVDTSAAFCGCGEGVEGWGRWLHVYASLLTGGYYGPAVLPYKDDPRAFARAVAARGWATDSAYVEALDRWIDRLADIFGAPPASAPVDPPSYNIPDGYVPHPIITTDGTNVRIATGWVSDGHCWVDAGDFAKGLGYDFYPKDDHAVIVKRR